MSNLISLFSGATFVFLLSREAAEEEALLLCRGKLWASKEQCGGLEWKGAREASVRLREACDEGKRAMRGGVR